MILSGLVLILLGVTIFTIAYSWLTVLCFRRSFLWGLGAFFFGLGLVFPLVDWKKSRTAFLITLFSLFLLPAGFLIFRAGFSKQDRTIIFNQIDAMSFENPTLERDTKKVLKVIIGN